MIRAALEKSGVDPDSVKLVAIPFPAMRAALNNGQVDAIWAPEPFMSQGLTLDGDRIVMAPGPVLGKFWPNGGYVALERLGAEEPGARARGSATAINRVARVRAGASGRDPGAAAGGDAEHPAADLEPARSTGASWCSSRKYAKQFGVISTLPNLTKLVPSSVSSGKTLQATVGANFATLRLDGKVVTTLRAGKYTFVVTDRRRRRASSSSARA